MKNIFEARSHSEQNPHIRLIDILKENQNAFFTFSFYPKLGINPVNEYGTPTGIYCYPVEEFYEELVNRGTSSIPFAKERPWCLVIAPKNQNKVLTDKATEPDFEYCYDKLKKKYNFNISKEVISANCMDIFNERDIETTVECLSIEDIKKDRNSKPQNPMDKIWLMTLNLARVIAKERNKLQSDTFVQNEWARLIVEIGYIGVYDSGYGVIHPNEPCQAVFFRKDFVDLISTMRNDLNEGRMSQQRINRNREKYQKNKSGIEEAKDFLYTNGNINGNIIIGAKTSRNSIDTVRIENNSLKGVSFSKLDFIGTNSDISFDSCSITANKGDVKISNVFLYNIILVNPKGKVYLNDCVIDIMSNRFNITRNVFLNNTELKTNVYIGANNYKNIEKCTMDNVINSVYFICRESIDLFNMQSFLKTNKISNCRAIFSTINEVTDTSERYFFSNPNEFNNFGFSSRVIDINGKQIHLSDKLKDDKFLNDLVEYMDIELKTNPKQKNNEYFVNYCVEQLI